jgi:hypothetical protein
MPPVAMLTPLRGAAGELARRNLATQRSSVREQADAPGQLPSLVATFHSALALLIIEILPGSG